MSGKAAKLSSDDRIKAKTALSTLERLTSSNNPDKDQIRYFCHKLLQLVTEQEAAKKDASTKAGLDIILLTLESCNDQATCMALVGTLTELSRGGNGAVKRLVTHDATRVLLHTLSYIGSELDWRLLCAIIQLLSKLGPKDRRFALRARLTGALSIILNTVRSSSTHSSQARLLPVSLSVLKLALTSSSRNASCLGRAGAINVLHRIIVSSSRKQVATLKQALASLNLLVRLSRANGSRAVKLGTLTHLLKMHQDYHKHDCKQGRNCAVRKSTLNVIKNIVVSKIGRKAFIDAGGLTVIYKSSRDYLEADYNDKTVESFLIVAILIIRRCQPKVKLPVPNIRCSFSFPLPGIRERMDSLESSTLPGDSDEDIEDDDNFSNEDDDNGEGSANRTGSGSKSSATSDSSRENKSKHTKRTVEDLKMYEEFFPELFDFSIFDENDLIWEELQDIGYPHASNEFESLEHKANQPSFSKNNSFELDQTGAASNFQCPPLKRLSLSSGNLSENFDRLDISSKQKVQSRTFPDLMSSLNTFSSKDTRTKPFFPGCGEDCTRKDCCTHWSDVMKVVEDDGDSNILFAAPFNEQYCNTSTRTEFLNIRKQLAETVQKLASGVNSVKENPNQLSQADAWGSVATEKVERQPNKCYVQRLIKSKVLDDLARYLYPSNVINRTVYSNDDKIYDKRDFPLVESEQPQVCTIVFPSEHNRSNDDVFTEEKFNGALKASAESSIFLPPLTATQPNKIVINIPTQENVSSSTSLSDETWPATYLDKNYHDVNSSLSSTSEELNIIPYTLQSGLSQSSCNASAISKPLPPSYEHSLKFDSRFESGNLRAAYQIREYEYDLVLNPDCNSNHHFQWFYFQVSNMKPSRPYIFNIINCEKKGSVVNEGMQPVMYSMTEAKLGRPYWLRIGRDTCYYRNHFLRSTSSAGGNKKSTFFTLTFTVTFHHDGDTCYLAYHYPYTYTKLQLDLKQFMEKIDPSTMYVRNQTFCQTLAGNPVPVLTITAPPDSSSRLTIKESIEEFRSRPYIFLTSRVHPGESNSSWTMRGTLRLLLTPPSSSFENNSIAATADNLRRSYIFKIVPMLNPDGVINGHHRCSLTGEDLNRTWLNPNPNFFPTIYHSKGLLQYLHSIGRAPLVYCDYHGHSRKMNVFLYGCSHRDSVAAGENNSVTDGPSDYGFKTLPKLLDHFASTFSLKNCSFVVEKAKLSTARVVVWKEFGVARSYTMESTYCGCDQGEFRGKQISTKQLEEMGSKFCEVLLHLKDRENNQRQFIIFESEDEDVEKLDELDTTLKVTDDENIKSPGCPANSDAELTPDEDVWNLDEAYDAFPTSNSNENNSSFREMLEKHRKTSADYFNYSFWRYDPTTEADVSTFSDQPLIVTDCSDQTSELSTRTSTTVDDASAESISYFVGKGSRKSRTFASGRISSKARKASPARGRISPREGTVSPMTGRVSPKSISLIDSQPTSLKINQISDFAVTTAPRPFESGFVLKKPPLSRSRDDYLQLPSTSGVYKGESKSLRSRKKFPRTQAK